MAKSANLNEMPFGLLGYPVLQAADILMPRAHLVPVGKDNEAHVELTREIARRFNNLYGDVFPIPDVMIGEVPTLVGTDGSAKMSKSLNNAILLSDDDSAVQKKVFGMYTDPKRIRSDIPGTVKGNPVFIYHEIFNSNKSEVNDLKSRYEAGEVGDVEVASLPPAAWVRRRFAHLRTSAHEHVRESGVRGPLAASGDHANRPRPKSPTVMSRGDWGPPAR